MDLNSLKSFARDSRNELLKSVGFKIDYVLSEDSHARRENPRAIIELENKIKFSSKEEVIEEVSYTWFNRFIALQYMDINGFNDVRVILPIAGNTRPEILSKAMSGQFDSNYISENTKNIVSSILEARSPSNNPENESYRLLLVSFCNKLHSKMPFLFEKIADHTELLMPDDLLSNSSILVKMRDVMTKDNCHNIEVIGWLFQFYISEKKDKILSNIKNNIKVIPENIPAATQLFTPSWIVKFVLENSLGRLWMLNYPDSSLVETMEFYISSDESDVDFIKINSPEEIRICDPACGSGHMLIYAFDLLYLMYKEEGYNQESIPSLILRNNLYGVELDQRAGQLALFSLVMKARHQQRNFFDSFEKPNICILKNIRFEINEIIEYKNEFGGDIETFLTDNILKQFEETYNFGSLIKPFMDNFDVIKNLISIKDFRSDLFLNSINNRILQLLEQSDYLSQKYHVVVANPPYMGISGMNMKLSEYLRTNYKDGKFDLFSSFMLRNTTLCLNKGFCGYVTPFTWMYLSRYEQLRKCLLKKTSIISLIQLEYNSFKPAMVPVCTFVLQNNLQPDLAGAYIKLSDFKGADNQAPKALEAINNPNCGWFYRVPFKNFNSIPGSPIAYFASKNVINLFKSKKIGDISSTRLGMATADNNKFLRLWYEISFNKFDQKINSRAEAEKSGKRWFPYQKGGKFRKWEGNKEYVVDWEKDGKRIQNFKNIKTGKIRSHNYNLDYIFQEGVTWNALSSSKTSARLSKYSLFDNAGSSLFPIEEVSHECIIGFLNSNLMQNIFPLISPTLNYQPGDISKLPGKFDQDLQNKLNPIVEKLILISREDWNQYETSWDFKSLKILSLNCYSNSLQNVFFELRKYWQEMVDNTIFYEMENNKILLEYYELQDEFKSEVSKSEITLTCNPEYRYRGDVAKEKQEQRLLQDTLKEFISYSVGCMFGRYSLDQPGLILANQGENLEYYLKRITNPSFIPDDDNVIPILNADWFEDDITARFKKFLRITFSDENFDENLRFIELSIGKDIRNYFLRDFYKDHIQTYKNRPIYWMFSSPKGSFNALIYMHRYQKDTVSILLEKYLREFLLKLRAKRNTLERLEVNNDYSSAAKNKSMREINKIDSILNELQNWEKEIIFPLASQRLELDLDDGVKINYLKFGTALKKISGLN